jgi:hypothetical protein
MRDNDYAVEDVIAFILVLLMVSTATTTILLWGGPAIEQTKSTINFKSTATQLDVFADITNQLINEGEGSSQQMIMKVEGGEFNFDDLSERFVIYYSLYEYDPNVDRMPFNFTVRGFDIGVREDEFDIKILQLPGGGASSARLNFYLYDYDTSSSPVRVDVPVPPLNTWAAITFTDGEITGKSCIKIFDEDDIVEYGEIWVFDIGSLEYTVDSGDKVVVENGGIISVTQGGCVTKEPRILTQEMLDGSKMTTFEMINITYAGYLVGSISPPLETKLNITIDEVKIFESRQNVYGDIKIKLYGEDAVVNAWYNFYRDAMGFDYYVIEGPEKCDEWSLQILDGSSSIPNYLFSLLYVNSNIYTEGNA